MSRLKVLFATVLLCMGMSVCFSQEPFPPRYEDRYFQDFEQELQGADRDDAAVAHQYAEWIRKAVAEDRINEAGAAIDRALGFSNVNSDIPFLAAFVFSQGGTSRTYILSLLDTAIEVNRWIIYSENEALVLKAQHLIAMRRYSSALAALDSIREGNVARDPTISLLPISSDSAMLRLKAFRGIAYNSNLNPTETAAFRTLVLSTMNRFSRDTRPAVIFLEYMHYRKKQNPRVRFEVDISDQQILDIIFRRLPVLVEYDSELAWMAAPFIQNEADAKRYIAGYRAGGFLENASGFSPNPSSVPLALNYGLINDFQAVEELFFNQSPLRINFDVINDTYAMLRSEEGREMFTFTLLNYSGNIFSDLDYDGIIDSYVVYDTGAVSTLVFDNNQDNIFNIRILFNSDGIPNEATVPINGINAWAVVLWDRYPFVNQVLTFIEPSGIRDEVFNFRLADFNFIPVEFITLGGSRTRPGIVYPVLTNQIELSRRTLVSFCESIQRNGNDEFKGAWEIITLEGGIPRQAVEILDEKIISITEFEGGLPVIQYIDFDLDGRMETIRRFHRPGPDYKWPDYDERFDYRKLISSVESDWRGDGRYITGEVYLQDGSVVYRWDIDGDGVINYSETKR